MLARVSNLHGSAGDHTSPLEAALKHESRDVVTMLLYHGVKPSADRQRADLLKLASEADDRPLVDQAIVLGAHDDLAKFCGSGHRAVVILLLDADANVDASDGNDRYPLVEACASGHADIVSLLLEHGADANCPRSPTTSPLQITSDRQRWMICRILLGCGADMRRRDGRLPWQILTGLCH